MTTIDLIRHAPHGFQGTRLVGRAAGIALPEASRTIAERLAARLADEGIAAVYCSPLDRTRQTAAPIAARLGVEARVEEDANEVDYGDWTDRAVDEIRPHAIWQRFLAERSVTRIPGGETMVEVQARMVRLVERLRAAHAKDRIALVSHGDPLRSVVAFYLGIPLDMLHRFEMSPASISILELTDRGARLVLLNETP